MACAGRLFAHDQGEANQALSCRADAQRFACAAVLLLQFFKGCMRVQPPQTGGIIDANRAVRNVQANRAIGPAGYDQAVEACFFEGGSN